MLKRIIFSCLCIILTSASIAQNPVKWRFTKEKVKGEENLYLLRFHAFIEDNWHMYSQDLPDPDNGPLATIFGFDENENLKRVGTVEEDKEKMHSEKDLAFDVMVNYYEKEAIFTQHIRLKEEKNTTINGYVSFMVCNNTTCLPPEDVEFSFTIEP